MTTDAELFRMLRAIMRVVDRHAEIKAGPGVVEVPMLPHEMKELRSAIEPFREKYHEMESLTRLRVAEIAQGAPPTAGEIAMRAVIERANRR
jgi:hypothetical protein